MTFEDIVRVGNRGHHHGYTSPNMITCRDGFQMSVLAGGGVYCSPRPEICLGRIGDLECKGTLGRMTMLGTIECDYPGPYTEVEVGFPTIRPEPWAKWVLFCDDRPRWDTVFGYVPVGMVRDLIALHGGEGAPIEVPEFTSVSDADAWLEEQEQDERG